MSAVNDSTDAPQTLDVRGMRKPDKHPTIFATFRALPLGSSFVLINDHDPKHLHDEFEAEWSGGYDWEYLERELRNFQIRITRRAAAPSLRSLGQAAELGGEPGVDGAVWRLDGRERDLDVSILQVDPDVTLESHRGPGADVLVQVLSGSGRLIGESSEFPLAPGGLALLPASAPRSFAAGESGLRCLLVQQRRQQLQLS